MDEADKARILAFEDPLEGILKISNDEVDGEIDHSSIFVSAAGKRLVRQVEDLKKFTMTGILFITCMDIIEIILSNSAKVFSDPELQRLINNELEIRTDLREEEKVLFRHPQIFRYFVDKLRDDDLISNYETLWGRYAVERYLGNFVFHFILTLMHF